MSNRILFPPGAAAPLLVDFFSEIPMKKKEIFILLVFLFDRFYVQKAFTLPLSFFPLV